MDRLRREHGRELIGALFVVGAALVLLVGYLSIRDEIYVAIQLPDVLISSIGAVILVAIGVAALRSADDKAILRRIEELEATNHDLAERVGYLGQLLEMAIMPDQSEAPPVVADGRVTVEAR
jgi:hypothetical protein